MNASPPPKFFLGVGATKTGISWLYNNLNRHEQVSLTPLKELSYFYSRQVLGPDATLRARLLTKHFIRNHYGNQLRRRLKLHRADWKYRKKFDYHRVLWELRYFLLRQTDDWYLRLFDGSSVTGDISPMYSLLNEESVSHISRLVPHARIIFGMRDPVERIWSHVKMVHLNEEIDDLLNLQKVLRRPLQLRASEYDRIHRMWCTYFKKSQIFIYFHEELAEDPVGLFRRICGFLGIEEASDSAATDVINPGKKEKMPGELRKMLIDMMLPIVERMIPYFDQTYPQRWHDKYLCDREFSGL